MLHPKTFRFFTKLRTRPLNVYLNHHSSLQMKIFSLKIFAILTIAFLPVLGSAQKSFYDGIDHVNNIGWKYTQTLYPNLKPELGIKKTEYKLYQSDYIIIRSCKDSTLIDSIAWITTKNFRAENYSDYNTINKEQKSVLNLKANSIQIDTIYFEGLNSILFESYISPSYDHFFTVKETIVNESSGDSTVSEFYSLEDVKDICITGYYFRRKALKMYSSGKPHYTWLYYNIYGELTRKTEYKMGVIIKDEQF